MNEFQEHLEKSRALTRSLHSFDIDLAIESTDKPYAIAGNFFYIIHAPDHLSYIEVRFNEISNPKHKLVLMLGLRAYHERIFITTPAGQAGNITILHGKVDPELFAVIDNRSASMALLSDVVLQLKGSLLVQDYSNERNVTTTAAQIFPGNSARRAFTIQAKSTNTGIIYIGFDDFVTSTKWAIELEAKDRFTFNVYLGPIYAIATEVDQKLGWVQW